MRIKRKLVSSNLIITVLMALWASSASAYTYTIHEDFSSQPPVESSTGLWDQVDGELRAPLHLYHFQQFGEGSTFHQMDLDVGDGHLGAFEPTTYSQFDEDGDPSNHVIVINTDNYPDGLEVTRFELAAGDSLVPTGSSPLIIKSLSDVIVDGTINCKGDAGEDATTSLIATPQPGGSGHCGGSNGGNGAISSVQLATSGSNLTSGVTGGGAGSGGNGAGGGGGGAFTAFGEIFGTAGSGTTGGAVGQHSFDPGFATVMGGAGGGGGDATTGSGNGAGGGGGGGVVMITALRDVTLSGTITADGGAGGGGATVPAGGGGGGGGGSIFLVAGDTLSVLSTGTVTSEGGAGGITGASAGGKGSEGRVFMSDSSGAPTPDPISTVTPANYSNSTAPVAGLESTSPGSGFIFVSQAYDTLGSAPIITSYQLSKTESSSNTVSLFIASGATSDFTPTWQLIDDVLNQPLDRYVRWKIELDNEDHTVLPEATVSDLSITVELPLKTKFDMVSGCGMIAGSGTGTRFATLILLLIPLFIGWRLKRSKAVSENVAIP